MNRNNEESSSKHLTVEALLKTKGICAKVWDEYTQVSRVLPKTGEKLFEPDGSWLENKQIDNNIQTTKNLIKLERVNRLSTLASAEWIPKEKRAKVTKSSGIDWNNYGHTINAVSYLIPEEALLLLETNNLELTYNGVSLSIQQAYELLINSNDSDCTLSEYRVFSQLARLGYRLQRFYYSKTTAEKIEESFHPKKKVIIDPQNGKWMGRLLDSPINHESCQKELKKNSEENVAIIEEVIDGIINEVELKEIEPNDSQKCLKNINDKNNDKERCDKNNDKLVEKKEDKLKEKSKCRVEILSEETILDPVKFLVAPSKGLEIDSDTKFAWPGSRIQRNVKLLPKRTDKKIPSFPSYQLHDDHITQKRKIEIGEPKSPKKSKHEVIELSDDDIEEIPIPMTRMEMLNCFPNVAFKDSVSQIIPKNYIPQSIKLQKLVYEYDREQLNRMRKPNQSNGSSNGVIQNNEENSSALDSSFHSNSRSTVSETFFQGSRHFPNTPSRDNQFWSNNYQQGFIQNGNNNFFYSNRFSNSQILRGGYSSSNFFQHKFMTSCSTNTNFYRQNFISNRWPSFHINIFRNIAMATFASRSSSIVQNTTNFYQPFIRNNMMDRKLNLRFPNISRLPALQTHSSLQMQDSLVQYPPSNQSLSVIENSLNESNEVYQASFPKMPANSWSDLKKKWKESKTITIEDEDDKMDCSEVEVVEQTIQPLVNAKNAKTLGEAYERLRIIKSTNERTVRKKKGDYKISYKIYSNTQNYRKSNPGPAMFHLVITSRDKNFLQPVELNRLQQDGDGIAILFAYVSGASISFMQAGIVSLPNLVDNK